MLRCFVRASCKNKLCKLKLSTHLSFWRLLKLHILIHMGHLQAKMLYKTHKGSLHCFLWTLKSQFTKFVITLKHYVFKGLLKPSSKVLL